VGAAARTIIQIVDDKRAPLGKLCGRLIAAGGACVVLRKIAYDAGNPSGEHAYIPLVSIRRRLFAPDVSLNGSKSKIQRCWR
jgi:hypothetical protein